ncbi:hypothetical protein N9Z41_02640 [bacterium]|nr:hypothetical protein [bacterium]
MSEAPEHMIAAIPENCTFLCHETGSTWNDGGRWHDVSFLKPDRSIGIVRMKSNYSAEDLEIVDCKKPSVKAIRLQHAIIIEELEDQLAKAMESLDEAIYFLDIEAYDILKGAGMYRIAKAYADLGGGIPDEWVYALNRTAELKGKSDV